MRIYLDDLRSPSREKFTELARSAAEFKGILCSRLKETGFLEYVSFDHDLGEELTGYDCAKFLVSLDMERNILAPNFIYNVHSANPVGRDNIINYLDSYLKGN